MKSSENSARMLSGVRCRNDRAGVLQSGKTILILVAGWPLALWVTYIGVTDAGYGRPALWNRSVGTIALVALALATPYLAKSFLLDTGVWPRLWVFQRDRTRYCFTLRSLLGRQWVVLDGEFERAQFEVREVVTDPRGRRSLTLWTVSSDGKSVKGVWTGASTARVDRLRAALADAVIVDHS